MTVTCDAYIREIDERERERGRERERERFRERGRERFRERGREREKLQTQSLYLHSSVFVIRFFWFKWKKIGSIAINFHLQMKILSLIGALKMILIIKIVNM
jgi:hypothetical protein